MITGPVEATGFEHFTKALPMAGSDKHNTICPCVRYYEKSIKTPAGTGQGVKCNFTKKKAI